MPMPNKNSNVTDSSANGGNFDDRKVHPVIVLLFGIALGLGLFQMANRFGLVELAYQKFGIPVADASTSTSSHNVLRERQYLRQIDGLKTKLTLMEDSEKTLSGYIRELESRQLNLDQLRKDNAALTAENAELTSQLQFALHRQGALEKSVIEQMPITVLPTSDTNVAKVLQVETSAGLVVLDRGRMDGVRLGQTFIHFDDSSNTVLWKAVVDEVKEDVALAKLLPPAAPDQVTAGTVLVHAED